MYKRNLLPINPPQKKFLKSAVKEILFCLTTDNIISLTHFNLLMYQWKLETITKLIFTHCQYLLKIKF